MERNIQKIKDHNDVKSCYENIEHFTEIYPKDGSKENPIPENIRVTVLCESKKESGFLIGMKKSEMGLQLLIASSWILHSELEKLVGRKLTH